LQSRNWFWSAPNCPVCDVRTEVVQRRWLLPVVVRCRDCGREGHVTA
jgi:hypothetical protein